MTNCGVTEHDFVPAAFQAQLDLCLLEQIKHCSSAPGMQQSVSMHAQRTNGGSNLLHSAACWYFASPGGGQMITSSSSGAALSTVGLTALLLLRLLTLFHLMGSSALEGPACKGPAPDSPHKALNSAFLVLLLDP